jgi:hypothetical protein
MIFHLFIHTANSFRKHKRNIQLKLTYILILLLFIGFAACDDIPNDTIEKNSTAISVKSINAPDGFVLTRTDSNFVTSVEFDNSSPILESWITVKSIDGIIVVSQKSDLVDNGIVQNSGDVKTGDNIFSTIVKMGKRFPVEKYNIDYYANIADGNSGIKTLKLGSHVFNYDNGQNNVAPVLSQLNIPLSVVREEQFSFSIKAEDPNGQFDIGSVYYELYRPDGTKVSNSTGLTKFPMFDDGATAGDKTKGDGIYTVALTFPANQQTGKWKFVFYAADRNGLVSDPVTSEITVN